MNRRPNRLKLKVTDSIDCEVVQVAKSGLVCRWRDDVHFYVNRSKLVPEIGDVVSVAHCGFSDVGNLPRFPKIVAVRREVM